MVRPLVNERQFTGSILRTNLEWVTKAGLAPAVRARVPEETRALFDHPPLPSSWISARHIDALLEALFAVGGEEKVLQLAEETTRASFGPVLLPLLKTFVVLFGTSPATMFSRLDSTVAVYMKGASFTFEEAGENGGVLRLRAVDQPARAWFLQWKGRLRFAFEMARVSGSIDSCDVDTDGKGAAYRVTWSA
jgi:hypothetical protein